MGKLLPTEHCETSPLSIDGSCPLLATVSVVVPIGPGDESWRELIGDLQHLPTDAEVILVATAAEPEDFQRLATVHESTCPVHWIVTQAGRAHQLNVGVDRALGDFVWLLHADTRVPIDAFPALEDALSSGVEALYYFDLQFRQDGPRNTRWNTGGVRFRSEYLGLPFGDQGFCLSRVILNRLGNFDESAPYGEDHLLVWAARRNGVPLRRVDATLTTSARKYAKSGWVQTTLLHLWRTARQALPEWWKYVRG